MSFITFDFFIFLGVSLIGYFFLVPKKYQWVFLLAISYAFYAFAGWKLLLYMLFTTAAVFLCALWLSKAKRFKKWIAALALLSNFGLLALFKWYNALAALGNRIICASPGVSINIPSLSLLLPLGISFYTFQAAGYLIDVYRGKIKPERNLARFALFVSFFPQLVQGPISRHSELADQLYSSRRFDYVEARRGFQLIIWGLFKKIVIADRIALITDTIFGDLYTYTGLYVLIGAVFSSIRLYADFSGGVDVARGVAQVFGINMPQNFRRPYFADSLTDFWRRWHISLNDWWRDYVFYPIVLSKFISRISKFARKHISRGFGKVIGVYVAVFLVRIINAMWHGAELFYVARGLFDGVFLVLGLALAPLFVKTAKALHINTDCFSWKLFRIIRTFIAVSLARVFIDAGSTRGGAAALLSIVNVFNPWILRFDTVSSLGLPSRDIWIIAISLCLLLSVGILQEKGISIRKTLEKQNIVFQWVVLLGGMVALVLWGKYGFNYDPAGFAYEGF